MMTMNSLAIVCTFVTVNMNLGSTNAAKIFEGAYNGD